LPPRTRIEFDGRGFLALRTKEFVEILPEVLLYFVLFNTSSAVIPDIPEMFLVFGLLVSAIVLFACSRMRFDLIALIVLLALMVLGILTPAEGLAGFANPIVITIAGLFVVGGALMETGVADRLGKLMGRIVGTRESSILIATMAVGATLSGFMSSTGTTAVLLPVIVSVARTARINPSKLLIPLSFSTLLGGTLTLIGTPPNIVVSNQLSENGVEGFGFFTFLPIGLILLVVGMSFMVLIGRHMLPNSPSSSGDADRPFEYISKTELAADYNLISQSYRLKVRYSSPLVGQTLASSSLGRRYGVTVMEIQNRESDYQPLEEPCPVTPATLIKPLSVLHVQGTAEDVKRLATEKDLLMVKDEDLSLKPGPMSRQLGLAEVLMPPRSQLLGKTLSEINFRDRYGVSVLGIKRLGNPIASNLKNVALLFGDTLLVEGTWDRIRLLQGEAQDFIVVSQPEEIELVTRPLQRAKWAMAILLIMIVAMTAGWLPVVTAVMLAAVAMVMAGCLNMEQTYRYMNWESVVLIAAMLPMSTALEKTGGVTFVAEAMTDYIGQLGPLALLAGVFILTSLFSHFISNTATAVLIAPIAFQAAVALGVAPQPFMMGVAVAASTSFGTPVATPSNTLVYGPGGYRFGDYLKVGLSMQLLILIVCLFVLPILFPF